MSELTQDDLALIVGNLMLENAALRKALSAVQAGLLPDGPPKVNERPQ